ncbi:MAG: hypothetical protein K6E85_00830 [Lachnospiraceae bacterium]|nr:hypothetical protein [Lachnospiraceae bacterium]
MVTQQGMRRKVFYGVLSMAFLDTLTLRGEEPGETRKALLMRIIPVSEISRKLVYLKGEYEDMDLAIIDNDGNYMIHGSQLKNSNLFEYYKSYNNTDFLSQREFEGQCTGETSLIEIADSKGRICVLAHTPVTPEKDWFLINIIPKSSLIPDVVDWALLGGTIGALAALLIFNMSAMMIFNRRLAAAAEEADRANTAKSNFLSMMSHDIRTPMNAITGFNEMIRRESSDPDILRYSEGIRMADKPIDFVRLEQMLLKYIPEGKIAVDYIERREDSQSLPDAVFTIPELDVNTGLSHCGDAESYLNTLKMYSEASEKNEKDIRDFWKVRDIKNLTIKLHALKSTSRVIGALKIGEMAAELEKAGRLGRLIELGDDLEQLMFSYTELTSKLSPLFEPQDDEDGLLPISSEELREVYLKLLEACSEFDYDTVVNMVEELSHRRIPDDEKTRMDAIRTASDDFDYDVIPEIIRAGRKDWENAE